MSKVQTLRAFVQQRLSAAAEEIFELFERTIAEYEEELCGQRKLLDAVFKPEVRLHRADVQLLLVSKEEVPPEQQDWSPSLDQEDPPEPPHIKEEWSPSLDQEDPPEPPRIKEELLTNQEGEQLPVKSEEDDEEKPQSSQLHQGLTEQMETEADGEDCGGPEPARNSDPGKLLQPDTSDSSEPETDDSCDWEATREPQSGSKPLENNQVPEHQSSQLHQGLTEQMETEADGEDCGGPEPARNSDPDGHLQPDSSDFSEPETDDSCDWEETREPQSGSNLLQTNSGCVTREKHFGCSECDKRFYTKLSLRQHMKVHSGQKPFSCSVCGKGFPHKSDLIIHVRVHTGEKPFSCPVCKKSFNVRSNLSTHMKIHTGEKPFSCSVCGKRFTQRSSLIRHVRVHTGEKPFSCPVCKNCFSDSSSLSKHMRLHTGKKPISCRVCGKTFTQLDHLKSHKCDGESSGSK